MPRQITRADILDLDVYERERADRRAKVRDIKKDRHLEVGPCVSFYFENYDTMFQQIHEMLRIEKGGDEQIADELDAYNPLIPKGRDLVATMMVEIDDPVRRDRMLRQMTHIEDTIYLKVGDAKVMADPEREVERTKEDGKTSSIHFLHFNLTDDQAAAFKSGGADVVLGIEHEHYPHMTAVPDRVRVALASDLD